MSCRWPVSSTHDSTVFTPTIPYFKTISATWTCVVEHDPAYLYPGSHKMSRSIDSTLSERTSLREHCRLVMRPELIQLKMMTGPISDLFTFT